MAISIRDSAAEITPARRRVRSRTLRRFLANRLALVGLVGLGVIALSALLAPVLPLLDPADQLLGDRLQGPSSAHWLGTDSLGRDVLSRLLFASRVSMVASLQAVAIAIVLGIPAGLLAGYLGGWFDALVSRFADALLSIPGLVLAFGIVGILGPGLSNAMTAVGIIFAPGFFRVARATAANLAHDNFILASRSLGCSPPRMVLRHLLPNAAPPLIVQISFGASLAIVAEASLSFLGLGVRSPQSSWGSMVNDGYRTIQTAMWPIVPPAVVISLAVLFLFFVGDGIRDATGRASIGSAPDELALM